MVATCLSGCGVMSHHGLSIHGARSSPAHHSVHPAERVCGCQVEVHSPPAGLAGLSFCTGCMRSAAGRSAPTKSCVVRGCMGRILPVHLHLDVIRAAKRVDLQVDI